MPKTSSNKPSYIFKRFAECVSGNQPKTADDVLADLERILSGIINDPDARDADKIAATTAILRLREAREEGLFQKYELVLKCRRLKEK